MSDCDRPSLPSALALVGEKHEGYEELRDE
jgi:hypothetical protein